MRWRIIPQHCAKLYFVAAPSPPARPHCRNRKAQDFQARGDFYRIAQETEAAGSSFDSRTVQK
jgi:hypothetical protein